MRTGLEGRDGERHSDYRLAESSISRQINVIHDSPVPRLVGTVPDLDGWDRFVVALDRGADEETALAAAWEEDVKGGQS
jgi:hypothetical protein